MTYRVDFVRPRAAVQQLNERIGTRVRLRTRVNSVHTGRLKSIGATFVRLTSAGKDLVLRTDSVVDAEVLTGSWSSASGHALSAKTERFTVRLHPKQRDLLQRAARRRGVSVSSFVLRAAIREARSLLPTSPRG